MIHLLSYFNILTWLELIKILYLSCKLCFSPMPAYYKKNNSRIIILIINKNYNLGNYNLWRIIAFLNNSTKLFVKNSFQITKSINIISNTLFKKFSYEIAKSNYSKVMLFLLDIIWDADPQWWETTSSDVLHNYIDGWLIELQWQTICLLMTWMLLVRVWLHISGL